MKVGENDCPHGFAGLSQYARDAATPRCLPSLVREVVKYGELAQVRPLRWHTSVMVRRS